eukprot:s1795_g1.t1
MPAHRAPPVLVADMEVAFVAPLSTAGAAAPQLAPSHVSTQGPSASSWSAPTAFCIAAFAGTAASRASRKRVPRKAEQELAKLPKHMQPVDMNKEYPAYVKGKNENSMMPQLVGDWGTPVPGSYKECLTLIGPDVEAYEAWYWKGLLDAQGKDDGTYY